MPAGAISRELLIINKRGLHARASAKFVQMVERFNAEVWVTRGSETVGGTSIMGLMMLAAGPGTTVVVSAIGPEAQAAIDAIAALVADKFNEEGDVRPAFLPRPAAGRGRRSCDRAHLSVRALERRWATLRLCPPSRSIVDPQNGFVTMPPSTRSAAPLVALDAFEQR